MGLRARLVSACLFVCFSLCLWEAAATTTVLSFSVVDNRPLYVQHRRKVRLGEIFREGRATKNLRQGVAPAGIAPAGT